MKKSNVLLIALAGMLLAGCDTIAPQSASSSPEESKPEPVILGSLFPSDQAVLSDDAVAKILSSKLELPAKSKLAIMKFQESTGTGWRFYGNYRWNDEDYQRLQQMQLQMIVAPLLASGQVREVTPLPSLLTPKQPTIPVLREAALRMQANLLLVYRIGSDTYSQYRAFKKDRAKAYSTCELVLLDVRTGLIPFTSVISREQLEEKKPNDLDINETMRRAEQASAISALNAASADLVAFLKSAPKKND